MVEHGTHNPLVVGSTPTGPIVTARGFRPSFVFKFLWGIHPMMTLPLVAPSRADLRLSTGTVGLRCCLQLLALLVIVAIPCLAPQASAFGPFRKEPAPLPVVMPDQPYDHPPSFKPYAQPTYLPQLNLWHLEERQVVRSPIVLSPDKTMMAYTEVVFTPATRQTVSTLYRVALGISPPAATPPSGTFNSVSVPLIVPVPKAKLPAARSALELVKTTLHWPGSVPKPSKKQVLIQVKREALSAKQRLNKVLWAPFDPNQSLGKREQVIRIGWERTRPHEFKTLTIVDYTPSGQRLLVWQRNGVSHLGLTPSKVWVYDRGSGLSKQYPQLNQALAVQFKALGDPLPEDDIGDNFAQDQRTWDLEPLGWLAGSETVMALQVWEYLKIIPDGSVLGAEKSTRRFKGVWAFDTMSQQVTPVRPTPPWPNAPLPLIPAGLKVD
jgi:hypothetical protein